MLWFARTLLVFLMLHPVAVYAHFPWQTHLHTRYLALGDSLTAGFGATPTTNGYAYLLYRAGIFERIEHTIFCNAAIPGATSEDVLKYQVPMIVTNRFFRPRFVTLTVGGNDLLMVLNKGATEAGLREALAKYAENLHAILDQLSQTVPENGRIFIGNLYAVPQIPATEAAIPAFNTVLAEVAARFPKVVVVDIYNAMRGRKGLLLIEHRGAEPNQVHPNNSGYRVIAETFEHVITGK